MMTPIHSSSLGDCERTIWLNVVALCVRSLGKSRKVGIRPRQCAKGTGYIERRHNMEAEVLVVGDTHGDFTNLNKVIEEFTPHLVLSTGDFGCWDIKGMGAAILPRGSRVVFVDGNHENHEVLRQLRRTVHNQKKPIFVIPQVYYAPRGTILSVNGKSILMMGGADSVDKAMRIEGRDWFPDEQITSHDINSVPKCKIDVIISHCAPPFVEDAMELEPIGKGQSSTMLEFLFDAFKPKKWFFGHYHAPFRMEIGGCEFVGLDRLGEGSDCVRL